MRSRTRTSQWFVFFIITIGSTGLVYLKCFGNEIWFSGTSFENFVGALCITPVATFWLQLIFHVSSLRLEKVYRPKEIWLISQTFQLYQGLLIAATVVPKIPGSVRLFLFVILSLPLMIALFAPFLSYHRLAYYTSMSMQFAVLLAYIGSLIVVVSGNAEIGGVLFYLVLFLTVSISALSLNAVGSRSGRMETAKRLCGSEHEFGRDNEKHS